MTISLIAAMSENRVIGANGRLPWGHLPDDIENLHRLTAGKKMIMGRKSYDTPDRIWSDAGNIVISRRQDLILEDGFQYAENLEQALLETKNETEVFIIGGGEIFKKSMRYADKIYLTLIHTSFSGDTFFPEIDPHFFEETEKLFHPADAYHAYSFSFLTFTRKN